MKLIFLKDIPGVGKKGEVKECKEGYAKNFLLPKRLAKLATDGALSLVAQQHKALETRKEKEHASQVALAHTLKNIELIFTLKTSKENAFGSITKNDILLKLREEGIELTKEMLELDRPIKKTGIVEIPVSLKDKISSTLTIHIQGSS
ncbi:MAG: 50S ribosomal protein L9 [Parcubacteria group bacterium]|nr:50S ribosomal protein L9 [Parcubacteria group bacterium]